jgi:hypothetical protein
VYPPHPFPVIPPEEIALYWIFTPPGDTGWGMTLDTFREALLRRDPEEYTRIWDDPADGPDQGTTMSFGITLADEPIEGIASVNGEGASLSDATAAQAAEFAEWLRTEIVPLGGSVQCNTRQGIEAELPSIDVTGLHGLALLDVLIDHVRQAE